MRFVRNFTSIISSSHKGYLIKKSIARLLTKSSVSMESKPMENSMRLKLTSKLNPVHLDIINESYMHNVPKEAETHFKVVVVSPIFENKTLIQRHRLINETLSHELENGVHALSIVAKTPAQWKEASRDVSPSPNCRGGFGK